MTIKSSMQVVTKDAGHASRGGWAARACAAVLLGLALDASALSLGRMQGIPLIGRTLQLTVPVVLNPGETPCVRAELVQGEDQPTNLQWRFEARADGSGQLRLTSNAPILEPIITVRLAIGCNEQVLQGYVLLAELPTPAREALPVVEAAPRTAPAVAPPAPAPARTAPTTPRRAEGTGAERRTARATAAPRGEGSAAAPDAAVRPERRTPAAEPGAARGAAGGSGGSRLQVDLLDFAIDQAPALKAAPQLGQPAAGALSRAEAQKAWQEINAPANEQFALLQKQAEATLAELRSLREVTKRQSDQLNQVSAQRDLARDILAGLAGAIALGLALLLWKRARDGSNSPWWQGQKAVPSRRQQLNPVGPDDSNFIDSSYPDDKPVAQAVKEEEDSGWSDFHKPSDAVARPVTATGTAAAGATGAAAAAKKTGKGGFSDSALGRSRLPSAEELLDVQEKANFFLAIGQTDEAIHMLESRLMEHLGGSPFLWMDLLDLCRRVQRPDDYERVRINFQKAFAARLPSFSEAAPNTEGLEHYPRALSRIGLLWPSFRVLKEIEKALFEDPAPGSIPFDLEASRDLLLLYSIAHEVVTETPDGKPYDSTALVALSDGNAMTTQPVPLMMLDAEEDPHREVDLDLDLDFSALESRTALPTLMSATPAVAQAVTATMPATPAPPVMELDFSLDDPASAPAALAPLPPDEPEPEPEPPEVAPAPMIDDLQLAARPAADVDQQVDTTPPEPPMLADLKLDGLSLEELKLDAPPTQEAPLPEVLDVDLDPTAPAAGRTGR